MKSRFESHITLIELTMALLFFLLSSVTILELFITAHGQQQYAQRLGQATRLAAQYAERMAGQQSPIEALAQWGFSPGANGRLEKEENGLCVCFDMDDGQGACLGGVLSVACGDERLIELPFERYMPPL